MATSVVTGPVLSTPIGRLAPSPTGQLHLGNARSFLLAWLSIRQQGGTVILRIEDLDAARVKPGAVPALIDQLRWLGLDWDFGPDLGDGTMGGIPVTQSRRLDRYRQVLGQLMRDGRIYRCRCTRSQIVEAAASAPHESGLAQMEGPVYPGTCRPRVPQPLDWVEFSSGDSTALRWALQPGLMQWHDQLLGPQSIRPLEQLGDFVIGRATGQPAYQLAVVVDDFDMGVTEVIRGSDLVLSTYRQLDILRHLGWPAPRYYHLPLMLDANGRRLAKRHGDSLAHFRAAGVPPQTIIGYLAWSAGLIDQPQALSPRDLIGQLDWSRLLPAPSQFHGDFLSR